MSANKPNREGGVDAPTGELSETSTTTPYPSNVLNFLRKLRKSPSLQNGSSSNTSPLQAKVCLGIVIVGAGLGGLATSIALARRGHSVVVLEQAQQLTEVGAGVQIPPNSSLLLERWGVNPFLAGAVVEPYEWIVRRWQNGKAIGRTQLVPDYYECFGAPYYVLHRAHYHQALYERAKELGVDVRVNSKVIEYDLEAPSVELSDGTLVLADLVVAADGVNSIARRRILNGKDHDPKPSGLAAYRATVDTKKIRADPELSWILDKSNQNIWIGANHHAMTYTIGAGTAFNMVLSYVDDSDPSTWKTETAVEDMRREFSGWDPQLTKIIHMVDKTLKWPLVHGNPLPTWISPSFKVIILGDAAHAMLPYMAQGAAMAVEDGAALAVVLSTIEDRFSIPLALKVWEMERLRRTSQMQGASKLNSILLHFSDGPEQEARDEAMRPEVEGKHFLFSPNLYSDPITQQWAHGYDAEAETQRAWDSDRIRVPDIML